MEKTNESVQEMLGIILEERQLQRTPDWVESTGELVESQGGSEPDAVSNQLAAMEFQSRTENTFTAAISYA